VQARRVGVAAASAPAAAHPASVIEPGRTLPLRAICESSRAIAPSSSRSVRSTIACPVFQDTGCSILDLLY